MNVSNLRDEYDPVFTFGYSDVMGSEKRLGISSTFSYYKTNEGFDNIDYDWIPMFHRIDFGANQDEVNSHLAPALAAAEEEVGQEVIFFHEDTEYNNYNIERERIGFSVNFDYKLGDNSEIYLKTTYNTRMISSFRLFRQATRVSTRATIRHSPRLTREILTSWSTIRACGKRQALTPETLCAWAVRPLASRRLSI